MSFIEELRDGFLRNINPVNWVERGIESTTRSFDGLKGQKNTYHQSQDPNWESYRTPPKEYTVEEEEKTTKSTSKSKTSSPFSDDITEGDFVEFTYQPGDTFGQKILDLGLATDNGLWGYDGDVNFYTRQLIDQDALDANGNVKLGQTFKLRRRK